MVIASGEISQLIWRNPSRLLGLQRRWGDNQTLGIRVKLTFLYSAVLFINELRVIPSHKRASQIKITRNSENYRQQQTATPKAIVVAASRRFVVSPLPGNNYQLIGIPTVVNHSQLISDLHNPTIYIYLGYIPSSPLIVLSGLTRTGGRF